MLTRGGSHSAAGGLESWSASRLAEPGRAQGITQPETRGPATVQTGKTLRLRHLYFKERAFIVPLDHPIYSGPVPGLEDPAALVRRIRELGVTGILIGPGTLELVAPEIGDLGVILRLDGTHSRLGSNLATTHLMASVEDALRMGADAVVVNIFVGTPNEDQHLEKLGRVAQDCRREGMPLVGEMIPAALLERHYGRDVAVPPPDERAEMIAVSARIGAEIGADLLKINYSGTQESFSRVVRAATRPVLIAGGMKSADDASFLQDVSDAILAGASGVVVGRNVWQRENLEDMVGQVVNRIWPD